MRSSTRAPCAALAAALCVLLPALAVLGVPPARASERPRVGLVLAGGGAKGAAHIGVLKVLEELRVPIDAIAGTSMGALVGGAYASGLSAAEMERAVVSVDWGALFDDDPPRSEWPMRRKQEDRRPTFGFTLGVREGKVRLPKGAISGQEVLLFLSDLTKGADRVDRFDRLPIAFRAVATDLETGEMVVFDRGPLAFAMRASMAVPGVFAPLETDDRIYVDGGLVRNFPVDVVRTMGVDVVIGVKLEGNPPTREQISSVLGTTGQMINILIAQNERVSLAEIDPSRDVLVTPDLGDITAADFARAADAIAIGAAAAERARPALARYGVSEADYRAWRERVEAARNPVEHVDEVRVTGLDRVNPELFEPLVRDYQGQPLDREKLDRDLNALYGRGDFERVSYRLDRRDGHNRLIVDVVEKAWGPGYLSFGLGIATDFSGDNRFGLRGTYRQTWVNTLGGEWLSELTIGNEPRLFSEFYQPFDADRVAFVAPYVDLGKAPYSVFLGGRRVARYDVLRARAGVDVGTTFGRFAELRAGILAGTVDAEVDTGSPLVPELSQNESGFRGHFLYDTRDSAGSPRSGSWATVDVFAPHSSLGAEQDYTRVAVEAGKAFSSGPHTVRATVRGGSAFGDPMPYYDQFPLGGFLKLSGYPNEAFRGNEVAYGSLVYYRQVASLSPPVGKGLYVGGSLEVGRHWDVVEPLNPAETRYGGSLFFAADTWLAPAHLGIGLSGDGDTAVYFLLGRP